MMNIVQVTNALEKLQSAGEKLNAKLAEKLQNHFGFTVSNKGPCSFDLEFFGARLHGGIELQVESLKTGSFVFRRLDLEDRPILLAIHYDELTNVYAEESSGHAVTIDDCAGGIYTRLIETIAAAKVPLTPH